MNGEKGAEQGTQEPEEARKPTDDVIEISKSATQPEEAGVEAESGGTEPATEVGADAGESVGEAVSEASNQKKVAPKIVSAEQVLRRGSVVVAQTVKKQKKTLKALAALVCGSMVISGSVLISENLDKDVPIAPCDWLPSREYECALPRVNEVRTFFGYDYGSTFRVHEYGKVRLPYPNNETKQWPACPMPPPISCFVKEDNGELKMAILFLILTVVGWLFSIGLRRCRKEGRGLSLWSRIRGNNNTIAPALASTGHSPQTQREKETEKDRASAQHAQVGITVLIMVVVCTVCFSFGTSTPSGFENNEGLFFTPAYRLNQTCGFAMGRPIFQSFEGAMTTILVVLLINLMPQVANAQLDREQQGEIERLVHEHMPMFFLPRLPAQSIVTIRSIGKVSDSPVDVREQQRAQAKEYKGITGNLVNPRMDRDGTLEVELVDGSIKRFHRRDLELSTRDEILRRQAELEAAHDVRSRFLTDLAPFVAIWTQVTALVCGLYAIVEQYQSQSSPGVNCGWLYFISLPYYLPVLQPWAVICCCGAQQIYAAISMQQHLAQGTGFETALGRAREGQGKKAKPLLNFRRASFVFRQLQQTLSPSGGGPQQSAREAAAAVALPSSRIATLNANIKDEEAMVQAQIAAMKWRLILGGVTYMIYMLPLCMYILPALLLFAPVVFCMVLTEAIWLALYCIVLLLITTLLATVLKANLQFAVPFLKTGAVLTTAAAFVVTLPMLLLPVSVNGSAYYQGAKYLDVSQWFMWQLKDIWLIGRDDAFEIPLLHFSLDFSDVSPGRAALTLSSLAVYVELSSALLHHILRRFLARWNIAKTEPATIQEWKESVGGAVLAVVVGVGVGFIVQNTVDDPPFAASPFACACYGLLVGFAIGACAGRGYFDADETRDFPPHEPGFEMQLVPGYELQALCTISHEKRWHDCVVLKETEGDVKLAFKRIGGQTTELLWFPKFSKRLREPIDIRMQGLNL